MATFPSGPPSRSLLRATASITVGSGLANVAMGAVALLTARQLGPAGRGFLVVVATMGSLTMLLSAMGTNLAGRVLLPGRDRQVGLDDYLGLALALCLVQFVLASAVGAVLLPLADLTWYPRDIALVGGYGAALLASLLCREALLALGRPQRATSAEAAGALGQLGLVAAMLAGGVSAPRAYLAVTLTGSLAQAAIACGWLRRQYGPLRPAYRPAAWRRLLRTGAPGLGLTLGQAVALKSDRLMLGIFLAPAVVGIYSVAATITELLWIAPVALAQVLVHPVAARQADYRMVAAARNRALLMVAGCAVVAAVAAPVLVPIAFGPAYASAAGPLRVLLLGAVAGASYHLDVNALAASGAISGAGLTAASGAFVAIAAGLLVIPSAGAVGAAWVSVAAYTTMAALARARLRRALAHRPLRPTAAVPR